MSKPVIMMRPEAPLEEAIRIMLQHKIKKIPLVTSHANEDRLVGLLSLSDIIESHSEIFSQLWEEALMIATVIAEKGEFVVVATQ
jgi:predicted transcriptional regulator